MSDKDQFDESMNPGLDAEENLAIKERMGNAIKLKTGLKVNDEAKSPTGYASATKTGLKVGQHEFQHQQIKRQAIGNVGVNRFE